MPVAAHGAVGHIQIRHHAARAWPVDNAPFDKRQGAEGAVPPVGGSDSASATTTAASLATGLSDISSAAGAGESTTSLSAPAPGATTAPLDASGSSNLAWQISYSSMASKLAATPSLINDPSYQSAFASAFGQDGSSLLSQYSGYLTNSAVVSAVASSASSAVSGSGSSAASSGSLSDSASVPGAAASNSSSTAVPAANSTSGIKSHNVANNATSLGSHANSSSTSSGLSDASASVSSTSDPNHSDAGHRFAVQKYGIAALVTLAAGWIATV